MGQQTEKEAKTATMNMIFKKGTNAQKRKVYYDGKIYESVSAATKALGLSNAASLNPFLKKGEFESKPIFYVDSERNFDNKKVYNACVRIAKALVGEMEAVQYKVACLAVEACEIRHGGISTNIYTMKDFANDVGLNPKSVQNWVRVYQVVATKLPSKPESRKEWSAASRTLKRLSEVTRTKKLQDDLIKSAKGTRAPYRKREKNPQSKRGRTKDIVTPQEVQKIFGQELEGRSEFDRFRSYISFTKQMIFNLKKRDFREISPTEKLELRNLLEEASELADKLAANSVH